MYDVVVVGASVAGCSVATASARRGRSVLLLEQQAAPKRKPCGEGILPGGVEALRELGVFGRLVDRGSLLTRLRLESRGSSLEAAFPAPALGIRRTVLAEVLLARAIGAGAELRTGVTATGLEIRARRVAAVQTSCGSVAGRVFVAADGMHSRVRRLARLDSAASGRRFGVAFHVRLPSLDPGAIRVRFADRAQVYVTPVGDREANVALLVHRRLLGSAASVRRLLAETLADDPLLRRAEVLDQPLVGGPFPRSCARLWRANLVLAGDAGGFFDGITGDGMTLALACAPPCSEAIDRYLDSGTYDGFRAYARTRRSVERNPTLLGRLNLLLARDERLASYAIHNLSRHPETFARLVAISCGSSPLGDLGPRDILALLPGR